MVFYEKYFNLINHEKVINSISKFLKELYEIPVNENEINNIRNKRIKKFNSDILRIKNYCKENNIDIDKINVFEKEYLDYINNFCNFHYIHGDFWEENMIISEDYQDFVGVVDFDDFSISDSAKDYASLLDFGFNFIYKLMDKNKNIINNKEDFLKRIKIYQKLIEIEDVSYILQYKNLLCKLDSKLKRLKDLNLIIWNKKTN